MLFVGARFAPRVPWALVVLIVGIGVSSWLDLAAQGVVTVGDVPSGLPPFGLPAISVTDIPPVLVGSLALALVGLAEGLSAARLFAAREGYTVDADQELLATGAANVAAGLSGGLGVAGSLSKTAASRRVRRRQPAHRDHDRRRWSCSSSSPWRTCCRPCRAPCSRPSSSRRSGG